MLESTGGRRAVGTTARGRWGSRSSTHPTGYRPRAVFSLCFGIGRASFFEDDGVAFFAELDPVHESSHQEDTPTAGFFTVLVVGGVGDLGGIESEPFVDNLDSD